ncbi:MAG TPA: TPM domain-containing protein [Phycisphaerales bacterium]|nr:TPM domain-containing protein [Phycisphaerales bacterium]
MYKHVLRAIAAVVACGLVWTLPARAQVTYPTRPGDRAFVADGAELITPEDEAAIQATAEAVLREKNIPIVAVTIESLSRHGAAGWQIERYAYNLFDEWGIGAAQHNYGVLLLVSEGDRKARIEFGAGWTRERDADAQKIMDTQIVPRFKRGEFSQGIRAGVEALAAMARGQSLPLSLGGQAARGPATPTGATPAPGAAEPGATTPLPAPPGPETGRSQTRGGGGVGIFGCGMLPLLILGLVAFMALRGLFGRRSAAPAYRYAGRRGGGGLIPGLLGGFLMGQAMGGRRGVGGGGLFGGGGGGVGGGSLFGGSGGWSGGSSFGGGFSGRGGATGSW